MASRVTYQPCAVCSTKFPVRPQAPHAKFCSGKCRMQFHRQEKQNTKQQSQTQEVTPMATQTPMQFVFSETECRSRCENEIAFYKSRIEKPYEGIVGAIIESSPSNLTLRQSLDYYHQMLSAGYTPLEEMSALPTATLFDSPLGSFVTIYLMKPDAQQESDCVKIRQQVKAQYEAELEAALNAEIDRQVALSLAKDERDRLQAEQQQRLSREQEVRDELAASRAKLRDQLIESGKLNADGSAA